LRTFITVLISSLSWIPVLTLSAQDEKEAIKKVIATETSSFMNCDYAVWADTWAKVPYAYWCYTDATTSSFVEGWDALDKTYARYFKEAIPSHAKITNEWIEIRVYGNGAYARFIQTAKDDVDTEETSQVRVLEKIDGKWKVVCVWAIAQNSKIK